MCFMFNQLTDFMVGLAKFKGSSACVKGAVCLQGVPMSSVWIITFKELSNSSFSMFAYSNFKACDISRSGPPANCYYCRSTSAMLPHSRALCKCQWLTGECTGRPHRTNLPQTGKWWTMPHSKSSNKEKTRIPDSKKGMLTLEYCPQVSRVVHLNCTVNTVNSIEGCAWPCGNKFI